ncbi:MAG: M15 family metallopeptidase [Myxococcales bacterium]|nr:M15 family metallopeptidase [Myxococcales bacterium]
MVRQKRLALLALLLAVGCAERADEHPAPVTTNAEPQASAAPAPAPSSTPVAIVAPPEVAAVPRCREQAAQEFLLRKGQIAKIGATKAEQKAIEAARKRSIEYRTRNYGRVPGFGSRKDNPHPPSFYAKRTKLMGVPVVLNQKVVPALACVEAALLRECAAFPYQPKQVGGLRAENTFKDYEVSNHVYGIALDIDPHKNPCCHCVGFWAEQEICKKRVSSAFERMAMPRCWVEVFERYGFHWLGHDELEDTMHFDFLGDPERVMQ